jgi:hypothetical protein
MQAPYRRCRRRKSAQSMSRCRRVGLQRPHALRRRFATMAGGRRVGRIWRRWCNG